MELFYSPREYLFNLKTTSSSEAKRLWRKQIREKWNNQCAYCGSEEDLTIDHIVPQSKGGIDATCNVVCCCKSCNQNKGHESWEDWYFNQDFFTHDRYDQICDWMKPEKPSNLYSYRPRRNNAS